MTTSVSSPSGHSRNGHSRPKIRVASTCHEIVSMSVRVIACESKSAPWYPVKDGLVLIMQNISLGHDFAEAGSQRRHSIWWKCSDQSARQASLAVLLLVRRWSAVAIAEGTFRDISPTKKMPVRCAVQAVNIRPITNRAVGARPGIEIDPSNRNGPRVHLVSTIASRIPDRRRSQVARS